MSGKHKRGAQQHVVGALVCIILLVFVVCIAFQGRPQGSDTAAGTETQTTAPAKEQAAAPAAEQSNAHAGETQAQANDAAAQQPAGAAQKDAETQGTATDADRPNDAAKTANANQADQLATPAAQNAGVREVTGEATGSSSAPEPFVMPQGAEYEENQVLVSINPSADRAEVEQLLARVPGIVAQQVSDEDMERGLVAASLEPGTSVEDAVNALRGAGSPVVAGSQPNYLYHVADDVEQEVVATQTDETVFANTGDATGSEEPASATVAVEATEGQTSAPEEVLVQDEQQPAEEAQAQGQQTQGGAGEQANAVQEVQTASSVQGAEPNDPHFGKQWNLKSVCAQQAWEKLGSPAQKVGVAVVDDGFKVDHPDLAGNIVSGSAYNSYKNNSDVSPVLGNHGTHVAGIVGAVANNGIGIAGAANNTVQVVPIKAFDENGNASTNTLDRAYQYILKNRDRYNIKVVNLSLGGGTSSDKFEDNLVIRDIREAYAQNIVTVGAACNQNSSFTPPFYAYPNDSEYVVSVINLEKTGEQSGTGNDASTNYTVARKSSSNYNREEQGGATTCKGKNISAPGSDIYSTKASEEYGSSDGTSQATPLVSGVVAMEFVANSSLTAEAATNILYASAHDLGAAGWDQEYGFGEVNADAAVTMAERGMVTVAANGELLGIKLEHGSLVYDGSAKKPSVTVVKIDSEGAETEFATDNYTVTYTNNTNAGMGYVTIAGKGDYADKFSQNLFFSIGRRTITNDMVSLSPTSMVFDARPYKPTVTVRYGDQTLKENVHYAYGYDNNYDAGTATVTVSGVGNYGGTVTKTFTISRRDINTSGITASCSPTRVTYNGSAQRPRVTLKHSSQNGSTFELDEGDDYTLSYANNTKVGTAKITVTGKGNYSGTRTLSFTIAAAPMSSAAIAGIGSQAYTGAAITPAPSVTFGGRQLSAGSDYTVGYRDNVNAGTATVTITGKGNFTGTASTTFQIIQPHVSYRTHVQRVGWQRYVSDGAMSGTSGRSLRLEGINIALSDLPCSGGIEYRAHVQRIGWQGWRRDGAMSGTKGKSLRLEAIEIRLYGEMANRYDVYYRVHCQRFGWMGWASNGDRSGSAGYSRRLEGIQIVLVPKGQPGPPTTYQGISQNVWRAFAQKGKK